MVAIKPLDQIASKWSEVTPGRQAFYQAGVTGAGQKWVTNAAAAESNQAAGVQAAIARKAFSAGIRRVGAEKYERKATTVGPARFAQGVQAATADYSAGFSKFHSGLAALSLPPRGPKGSPQNYQRVPAVGDALRKIKLGGA